MVSLKDAEIEKLSAITEVPPPFIQKLITMGIIDPSKALDVLIAYDFKRVKRRGVYKVGQIRDALAIKYNVPLSRVLRISYQKFRKQYSCTRCSKIISRREWLRGSGKCRKCFSESITL